MNHPVLIAYFSAACTLLMVLWNVFFAPSRADKKELEKRLSNLELHDANHESRLTGFSVQMERQNDSWEARCGKIEGQLSDVGRMREDLAVLRTRMDSQSEGIKEIKDTMNRIFNLLQPSKN